MDQDSLPSLFFFSNRFPTKITCILLPEVSAKTVVSNLSLEFRIVLAFTPTISSLFFASLLKIGLDL